MTLEPPAPNNVHGCALAFWRQGRLFRVVPSRGLHCQCATHQELEDPEDELDDELLSFAEARGGAGRAAGARRCVGRIAMHSARTLAVRAAALTPAPTPAASTTAAAAGAGGSFELSAVRPRLRGAQVQWHPGAVQVSVGAHACSSRRVWLPQNTGQHERHRWAVCQLRVECKVVPLSRNRLRLEAPIHQPTHAIHHVGLRVPGQGDELLAFGGLARPPQQTNGKLRAAVAGRDTADGIGGGCIGVSSADYKIVVRSCLSQRRQQATREHHR